MSRRQMWLPCNNGISEAPRLVQGADPVKNCYFWHNTIKISKCIQLKLSSQKKHFLNPTGSYCANHPVTERKKKRYIYIISPKHLVIMLDFSKITLHSFHNMFWRYFKIPTTNSGTSKNLSCGFLSYSKGPTIIIYNNH